MFWEDKRTAAERQRDLDFGDKLRAESVLALGVLKNTVRPLLDNAGVSVGLAGTGSFSAEMLLEIDGVTYKMTMKVDHDS
jgi:hypothetical protein